MEILSFSQIKDKSQIHFLVNLTSKLTMNSSMLSPLCSTRKCQVCFPRGFPSSDYWFIPGKTDTKLEKSQFEAQATQQSSKLKQQRAGLLWRQKHQCSCLVTFGTAHNGQGAKQFASTLTSCTDSSS